MLLAAVAPAVDCVLEQGADQVLVGVVELHPASATSRISEAFEAAGFSVSRCPPAEAATVFHSPWGFSKSAVR